MEGTPNVIQEFKDKLEKQLSEIQTERNSYVEEIRKNRHEINSMKVKLKEIDEAEIKIHSQLEVIYKLLEDE